MRGKREKTDERHYTEKQGNGGHATGGWRRQPSRCISLLLRFSV
jgi:hypothetical protein